MPDPTLSPSLPADHQSLTHTHTCTRTHTHTRTRLGMSGTNLRALLSPWHTPQPSGFFGNGHDYLPTSPVTTACTIYQRSDSNATKKDGEWVLFAVWAMAKEKKKVTSSKPQLWQDVSRDEKLAEGREGGASSWHLNSIGWQMRVAEEPSQGQSHEELMSLAAPRTFNFCREKSNDRKTKNPRESIACVGVLCMGSL